MTHSSGTRIQSSSEEASRTRREGEFRHPGIIQWMRVQRALKKVVYIDDDCGICRFVGRLLESVDNREEFTVAPISSTAPEYGGNIKRDEIRLEEKEATGHGADAALVILCVEGIPVHWACIEISRIYGILPEDLVFHCKPSAFPRLIPAPERLLQRADV